MQSFTVKIRTEHYQLTYPAIAPCSIDLVCAAIDAHGICAVSVIRIGG